MFSGMLRSMKNKLRKIGVAIFAVGLIAVISSLILPEQWDFVDVVLEQRNPADVSMSFAMTISDDNSEMKSLRSSFSERINKNLSDNDFELLHNNFSKEESWQEFFGKVPERKFKLLPTRETGELGLKGVTINLLLVPSITGWKIDGLKSVRRNQKD